MATPLLTFAPTSTNFRYTPANNVVATRLEGGVSRRRLDIVGGAHIVDCTWILNKTDYTNVMGFFRERTQQGTLPFRMNMITDVAFVMPHVCICAQDPPQLVQQSGDSYWVQTVLEVTPNPTKSFELKFESDVDDRIITNTGGGSYPAEWNQFPIGRSVTLTGTQGTSTAGDVINLDGTYTILGKPGVTSINLVAASGIAPDWTVLAAIAPFTHFPANAAVVLVPV